MSALNEAYRQINALGGGPTNTWEEGYVKAIDEALAIIESLGGRDPDIRRHKVDGCPTCAEPGNYMPPHDASPRCESGKQAHCSCDICF